MPQSLVNQSDRSICEGKLTLNECWLALSSVKNGKSPGDDGLYHKLSIVIRLLTYKVGTLVNQSGLLVI